MTIVENSPKELSAYEKEALRFAEELNENPDLDPVAPLTYFWQKYSSGDISFFERTGATEFYLDHLLPEIRKILEEEKNGTTLLREVTNKQYSLIKRIKK